jgi:hypothetical protein
VWGQIASRKGAEIMRMTLTDHEVSEKWKTRQGPQETLRSESVSDHLISQLFRVYFNNKMTLLIFLIQSKTLTPNPYAVEGVIRFLDDLYHHMMTGRIQAQHHHALEGLKSFCQALPDVSQEQRDQAKAFVRSLYHAMGMNLKADI